MSAATEVSARVRRSDPRPSHCSGCFRGAEEGVDFIDFDTAIDRGSIVTPEGALVGTLDDLHLCAACVREAAQVLELKPDLHARQLREIRRLELSVEHWRDSDKRKSDELERLRARLVQVEGELVGKQAQRQELPARPVAAKRKAA